jgi:surface polysaccharide O-acyltransferase-like enzyme
MKTENIFFSSSSQQPLPTQQDLISKPVTQSPAFFFLSLTGTLLLSFILVSIGYKKR